MSVIHEKLRIAGESIEKSGRIEVRFPYDNTVVGTAPKASREDVRKAFEKASTNKARLSRHERSRILETIANKLVEQKEDFARLITLESGLCLKDTRYEVGRAYDVFKLASILCLKDDSETFACDITPHGKQRRIYTQRSPLRSICAITPFNHPLNQVAHKIAPSIATGNAMVLKPSEKTPLTAYKLADVIYDSGLPPQLLSVVTGDPSEIAEELITNEHSDLVSFTGGVAIGKKIAAQCGYRRQVLELGGNSALIVMDDADLDEASSMAVAGSYKNSGQRCTAVKRILLHEKIADAFIEQFVEKSQKIRFGYPLDEKTDMGTVIDEAAAQYCETVVDLAIKDGAKLLLGHSRSGALYAPTVIDHVPRSSKVVKEECFGPVSPIIRFKNIDEAIEIVNETAYGLSSGVFTNRLDVITRFVNELDVGTVNIREVPGYRIEMSPFGGIKDSGLGYKEGVIEAMKAFTNVKTYSLPWQNC